MTANGVAMPLRRGPLDDGGGRAGAVNANDGAPSLRPHGFELGNRDELAEAYPEASADIARFTRNSP